MAEHNGWEDPIFSVLILEEKFSLTGLSNTVIVVFFPSVIKLSIFLPLNPATHTIGNAPKILFSRSKEQDESRRLPPLPHLLPPIPPIYSEGHYNGNLI